MRGLIKFSGGLFVVIGFLTFLVGGALALTAMTSYDPGSGLLVALAAVGAGASIVLVGGSTFMLCSIDERLETNPRTHGNPTTSQTPVRTPQDYTLLDKIEGNLPPGWYKAAVGENASPFYHNGGPKTDALARTDFTNIETLPIDRTIQVQEGFYRNPHGAIVYHDGGFVKTILRSVQ